MKTSPFILLVLPFLACGVGPEDNDHVDAGGIPMETKDAGSTCVPQCSFPYTWWACGKPDGCGGTCQSGSGCNYDVCFKNHVPACGVSGPAGCEIGESCCQTHLRLFPADTCMTHTGLGVGGGN